MIKYIVIAFTPNFRQPAEQLRRSMESRNWSKKNYRDKIKTISFYVCYNGATVCMYLNFVHLRSKNTYFCARMAPIYWDKCHIYPQKPVRKTGYNFLFLCRTLAPQTLRHNAITPWLFQSHVAIALRVFQSQFYAAVQDTFAHIAVFWNLSKSLTVRSWQSKKNLSACAPTTKTKLYKSLLFRSVNNWEFNNYLDSETKRFSGHGALSLSIKA